MFMPSVKDVICLLTGNKTIVPLINKLEDKLGTSIQLDPKTIRTVFTNNKQPTPKTQKKLDGFMQALCEVTGAEYQQYDDLKDSTWYRWDEWAALATYQDNHFPLDLYPETRNLIKRLAHADKHITHDVIKNGKTPGERFEILFHSSLSQELSDPDLRESVSHTIKSGSIPEKDVFEWSADVSMSLLFRIMACFDVEFTQRFAPDNEVPEVSFMGTIMPMEPDGELLHPIKRLLHIWRRFLSEADPSSPSGWNTIASFHPGLSDIGDRRTMILKWASGKYMPDNDMVYGLLKNIENTFPDFSSHSEFTVYLMSNGLTRIYKELKKAFPHKSTNEILLYFKSFKRHRNTTLKELGYLQ